jgi:hypothetical protein
MVALRKDLPATAHAQEFTANGFDAVRLLLLRDKREHPQDNHQGQRE